MNPSYPLVAALAGADNQPAATFAALSELTAAHIGVRLFTIMIFDARTRNARRIFSSAPDAYPVGGTKPVNETFWTEQVLDRHETFVANSIEGIAEVFYDHELIFSLGCESALNIPVVVCGDAIGTLNCLHEKGHYTPERVRASDDLKLPGAAALLLARSLSAQGAQK